MSSETSLNRPTPFEVETTDVAGIQIIAVKGELDMATAPALEAVISGCLADAHGTILVNLTDCDFMDSTGIALIVRTWQMARSDGDRTVAVCCAKAQVERVLQISGVDSTIPLYENLDAAMLALNGSSAA